MEKITIDCECNTHKLEVSFDEDDNTFFLAMFNFGYPSIGIWRRIKLAWRILIKDTVYDDQLILSPEESLS